MQVPYSGALLVPYQCHVMWLAVRGNCWHCRARESRIVTLPCDLIYYQSLSYIIIWICVNLHNLMLCSCFVLFTNLYIFMGQSQCNYWIKLVNQRKAIHNYSAHRYRVCCIVSGYIMFVTCVPISFSSSQFPFLLFPAHMSTVHPGDGTRSAVNWCPRRNSASEIFSAGLYIWHYHPYAQRISW